MGSIKPTKTKRGYFGKVESSLNEKLVNVEWGESKVSDLFSVNTSNKRFDANKVKISKDKRGYPYIVRQSTNNGRRGYIQESPEYLNEKNTIAFGQDTATMFYQSEPYFTGDKIKILKPKFKEFNQDNAQFFLTAMEKSFSSFSWGSSSFNVKIIENQIVKIPVKDGKPDFEFMESFIAELEAERIVELEAYLEVTGLSDCELTDDEQKALNKIGNVEWGEFKVGDLFEKLTLRNKNSNFNKLTDTSKVQSDEFDLPLVNAKVGDNGIMFYGRSEDFESEEMTIDVISNGAIATGTVYAQPQKTGVLWDAYLLKSKFITINKSQLIYLSASLQKSIKLKFGWEYKAVWSKVQKESIQLPVKDGKPDFEIMTQFISAIQKIVIKDVVEYADTKIQAHKEVVLN